MRLLRRHKQAVVLLAGEAEPGEGVHVRHPAGQQGHVEQGGGVEAGEEQEEEEEGEAGGRAEGGQHGGQEQQEEELQAGQGHGEGRAAQGREVPLQTAGRDPLGEEEQAGGYLTN